MIGIVERKIKDNNYFILHVRYDGDLYYDRVHKKDISVEEDDEYNVDSLATLLEVANRKKK